MSQANTLQLRLAALLSVVLLVGCSGEDGNETTTSAETSFNTTLDMQQLMAYVLEPAADVLWDSGGWVLDASGYEELYPTTDDGWDFVRAQAAVVVETGNLLALPGRARDNDAWLVYSQGLSEAGLLAMDAIANRDEEAFFQAGAQLYSVCTACHQGYDPEINSRFADETQEQ